ncbi:MAG: sodium ion-translocating decarboxylase subunit beta, partial [Spirochaetia bacterium]|nr:sodium ion-translocating decarboxylase subunit beta [Spirochaetia bacterium]
METELNNKKDKYKYLKITTVICLMAVALSFAGCGKAGGPSTSSGTASSHSTTIVKGSENIKPISVSSFFKNVAKNTGIYKMIHTPTPAELAEEKASKEAMELAKEEQAAQAAADLAAHPVAGWQRLIMLAIGFLIVYLAVVKGFEPLLLIPIGFGTILVNIPGAGMGDAPDGMLHIIYNAG